MYKLIVGKQAEKYISRLDSSTRKRILKAMVSLAESPFGDTNVKRLKGQEDLFRKRVGDLRIIFRIDEGELVILVLKVAIRGGVYKD